MTRSSGQDREVASLALPGHAAFLYAPKLSRDGSWCVFTVSPEGRSTQVDLSGLDQAGIRLAGVFTAPLAGPRLVFSPSGTLAAVLGSGTHDREGQRRVSVYRLEPTIAVSDRRSACSATTRGG